MNETIGLALFVIAVLGAAFTAFWRIQSLIKDVRTEAAAKADAASVLASMSQAQLAEHRLHVAETYVTKAGMSEQTDRIMKAIGDITHEIRETNKRLDAWLRGPWADKEK